jgi:hypothetical protein
MAKGSGRLRQAVVVLQLAEAHYRGRGPRRRRSHPWVYGWDALPRPPPLPGLPAGHLPPHRGASIRELFADRPCPSLKVPAPLRQGGRGGGALGPLRGTQGAAPAPPPPRRRRCLLMDSTGLAHRSKGQRLRWRRGKPAVAGAGPQPPPLPGALLPCAGRLLVLEGVAVGPAYASDVRLGLRVLGQGQGPKATSWPTPASMPSPCGNWQPRRGLWRTSPGRVAKVV